MGDPALRVERRYLLIAAAGNLLLGCVGLVVASAASSQAILLDGFFNITYFITGLITLKIAGLVARGDDERFPHGYGFFEPLINGIKSTVATQSSAWSAPGPASSATRREARSPTPSSLRMSFPRPRMRVRFFTVTPMESQGPSIPDQAVQLPPL